MRCLHIPITTMAMVLACQIGVSWSFERKNPRFPAISHWGRTIRSAKKNSSLDSAENLSELSKRRKLILGSAAALSSALLSTVPRPSLAAGSTVILEDSEARRIDIFERNVPSVVFIDTFTEKQDAFSPNVMEVPLGAGSGFVWDKEGHIGE